MYQKQIIYFGESRVLACDGKCHKAWGINGRPVAEELPGDDWVWFADGELGDAPEDPGTYEGWHAKPINATNGEAMNKWCARECERSVDVGVGDDIKLPDWSKRQSNMD